MATNCVCLCSWVRVGDLEGQLTVFINRSFEGLTSNEQSMALLEKYQTVLHREAMIHDLTSKVISTLHFLCDLIITKVHKALHL